MAGPKSEKLSFEAMKHHGSLTDSQRAAIDLGSELFRLELEYKNNRLSGQIIALEMMGLIIDFTASSNESLRDWNLTCEAICSNRGEPMVQVPASLIYFLGVGWNRYISDQENHEFPTRFFGLKPSRSGERSVPKTSNTLLRNFRLAVLVAMERSVADRDGKAISAMEACERIAEQQNLGFDTVLNAYKAEKSKVKLIAEAVGYPITFPPEPSG